MDEQKNVKMHSNLMRDILFVIRRNIFLALAVIILVSGLGVGYSYMRKPNYIASHTVSFLIDDGDKNRENINELTQYIDTVVDFCDEGVVLDRANAYYSCYIDGKNDGIYQNIEEFYNTFEKVDDKNPSSNQIFNSYDRGETLKDDNFLVASAVSTETVKNEGNTNWVFDVRYTDKTKTDAIEKNYILVLAYMHEIYDGGEGDAQQNPYFSINAEIRSFGYKDIVIDVSQAKIIIIAVIIGVVLSLVAVYLKNLLDNTVRDEEDLERLTGVAVLGFIADRKEEIDG